MGFGGKIDGLNGLSTHGICVPETHSLPADAQAAFFDMNDLAKVAGQILARGQSPYGHVVEHLKSHRPKLPKSCWQVYDAMQSEGRTLGLLRSSADCEDGKALSFAGMFSSIPFALRDRNAFARALIGVWTSGLRPHVLEYLRLRQPDFDPRSLLSAMNVACQPMIDADASGVLFARHTEGGQRARVIANFGAGEALNSLGVQHTILDETADDFAVTELTGVRFALRPHLQPMGQPGEVLQTASGEVVITEPYRAHMSFVRLPKAQAVRPCLGRAQRSVLFKTLQDLIRIRGDRDFECEFLFEKEQLIIVQIRPITAFDAPVMEQGKRRYIVHGDICGPVAPWRRGAPVEAGQVLAVGNLDYAMISVLGKCAGVLVTGGSPHSHVAIICRELGVPVALISGDELTAINRKPCIFSGGALCFEP